MNVPSTRTLPRLLRRELDRLGDEAARLFVCQVVSAPDASHVQVSYAGDTVTIPRLTTYTSPTAGKGCFVLATRSVAIAIGEVK